jgi:D-psicose/D-tagatose/L-ribulose 3-epimerase
MFRFSMCNEAFEKGTFADACRAIAKAGYSGIEIAPYTLAEDPVSLSSSARAELRGIMAGEGLAFAGLHWLMVGPKGLHVTTPDAAVRKRSWEHVRRLVDLCADLGPAGVMVFGSPGQRGATGGIGPAQAARNFVEGLASVAPHALERGVAILVEALPHNQCDVIRTLDEAAAIVRELDAPAVQTLFDVHNTLDETEPHAALVERYFEVIRHVHVNEMDGRHIGAGDYDLAPVLRALARRGYKGWISLEAFDFTPGPERIAEEAFQHLKRAAAGIESA